MALRSLSLAQRVKILIAVPLAFGLCFVSILFLALEQAERESRAAERDNAVYANGHIITTNVVHGFQSLVQYRYLGQAEFGQAYEDEMATMRGCFAEIKKLLKDDKKLLKGVKELEDLCELMRSHMNEAKRSIEIGETWQAEEQAKELKNMISIFETRMKKMLAPFEGQGLVASRKQREFRQTVKNLLIVGIFLQVLIAFALATGFSKRTLDQLTVLMDNMRRMKAGEQLNPTLKGQDELAQMDLMFHIMAQSITDATESLKLSEARIRAVIEGLPMGVAVLHEDRTIHFLNPAAQSLFGYYDGELSGRRIGELVVDPKKKVKADQIENVLFTETSEHTKEFLGVSREGKQVPLDITTREFQGPEGKMLLVGMLDVTERQAVEQMKRDFVAMVTHDLRSPLTSIRLSGELMRLKFEEQLTDEWRRLLHVQDMNCMRLLGLINDLLDLEKLEAGMMTIDLAPVFVQDIFEKAEASVNSLAATKEIKISWTPTDLEIIADADRIVQVLVNLLSNSIKFSEQGKSIELYAEQKLNFVEISVQDHGRGIPEEKIATIFDRFTQVKKEDGTKKGGGTGLGLAICKSIVESHKGQIGVESEKDKGSRFWLCIPSYSEGEDPDLD
ncbi:MAG: PAS domain S-box protein [Candidatus Obscuribacterales bacterium]|nr:PAS domain S-box protein [Candidatus Obscuribacterales bacterium]